MTREQLARLDDDDLDRQIRRGQQTDEGDLAALLNERRRRQIYAAASQTSEEYAG